MRFGPVPLEEAEGKVLGHNISGRDGERAFRKGRRLRREDLAELRRIGRTLVYVAQLEDADVDENTAAARLAEAAIGAGLNLSRPANGRVNIRSPVRGVLRVDPARLGRLNEAEGITLATLRSNTSVRPRQIVATVKVIPFAVPASVVAQAEAIAREAGPVVEIDPIEPRMVGLILSGPPELQESLLDQFAPLQERVEALGSRLELLDYVPVEEEVAEAGLVEALKRQRRAGARLILLAGQTAVMDRQDVAPRAIEQAGGRVECLGAPVDPGNLLMLGYLEGVPILGAPGCARSRKTNVVDWVLPRLLAGERLSRADIFALGHGGLLEDVPERPMPRSRAD